MVCGILSEGVRHLKRNSQHEVIQMSTATEVEVRFTLAISEGILQHKGAAEQKAKTAYVLELLRQGDISAGRAAKLLNISRWRLSDLMSEAGICLLMTVSPPKRSLRKWRQH